MSCPPLSELVAAVDRERGFFAHFGECESCRKIAGLLEGARLVGLAHPRKDEPGADCLDAWTLASLLDPDPAEPRDERSIEHLAVCACCAGRLIDAWNALESMERSPPARRFWRRSSAELAAWGAAAAAVAAVVLFGARAWLQDPLLKAIDAHEGAGVDLARRLVWPNRSGLGMAGGAEQSFDSLVIEAAKHESQRLHGGAFGEDQSTERDRTRERAVAALTELENRVADRCNRAAIELGKLIADLRAALYVGPDAPRRAGGEAIIGSLEACAGERLDTSRRERLIVLLRERPGEMTEDQLADHVDEMLAEAAPAGPSSMRAPAARPRDGPGEALREGPRDEESASAIAEELMRAEALAAIGDVEGARRRATSAASEARRSLDAYDPLRARALLVSAEISARFAGCEELARDTREALIIDEQVFGRLHPDTALAKAMYAGALRCLGQVREARALYEDALDILLSVSGPDEARTLDVLSSVSRYAGEDGDRERELWMLERVVEGRARGSGLRLAQSLMNLGMARLEYGDALGAIVPLEHALQMRTQQQGADHPHTASAMRFLAFALDAAGDRARAKGLFLSASKIVLEAFERGAVAAVSDVEVIRSLGLARHDANRDVDQVLALFDAPNEVVTGFEAALRWQGASFRAELHRRLSSPPSLANVCAALRRADAVLIDWVHIVRAEYRAEGPMETPRYLVFAVDPRTCKVARADLGDAVHIDALEKKWEATREELAACARDRAVAFCRSALGELRASAADLRRAIFDPIARHVRGERIFVVTDGRLARVALGALPGEDGRPLLARFEITQLPYPAALAEDRRSPRVKNFAALVAGDVDYGDAAWDRLAAPEHADAAAALKSARISPITILEREDATVEAILNALPKKKIIHLSTHGYADDGERAPRGRLEGDPLLHSALIFAGGKITARELAGLPLAGTDLVVLSACETFGGEMITGERPLGLASAFLSAGVERAIVSLWEVPAEETRRLFALFYRNVYEQKPAMSIAAGLRAAMLELREELERELGLEESSWFWAGFVLLGDGAK